MKTIPCLEVLLSPAEFQPLSRRDLHDATCVVFDVFRATSTMMTALQAGVREIIPVAEIPEALSQKRSHPDASLAGERNGLRISAKLSGGVEFDFGNSPREFRAGAVPRRLIMTTTNGTRGLRACAHARRVYIGSFLNHSAMARRLRSEKPRKLVLVCSGTVEEPALEDILGAGALADALWPIYKGGSISDGALLAREYFRASRGKLQKVLRETRNGRRLRNIPDLKADVAICSRLDTVPFCARLFPSGIVTRI